MSDGFADIAHLLSGGVMGRMDIFLTSPFRVL
jgi:hypothetical protein